MSATALASKLRRARRNGTGLRIEAADLETIAQLGIYEILARAEAEEMCLAKTAHIGAIPTGSTNAGMDAPASGKSRGQSAGFQYIEALTR